MLSYDRVLEITKELSGKQIKTLYDTNVFVPTPLKKCVLIVLVRDKNYFNATSSIAVRHFHGTGMSTMQIVSEENLSEEISCNTDIEFTSNMTDITSKTVLQIHIRVMYKY